MIECTNYKNKWVIIIFIGGICQYYTDHKSRYQFMLIIQKCLVAFIKLFWWARTLTRLQSYSLFPNFLFFKLYHLSYFFATSTVFLSPFLYLFLIFMQALKKGSLKGLHKCYSDETRSGKARLANLVPKKESRDRSLATVKHTWVNFLYKTNGNLIRRSTNKIPRLADRM